MYYYPVSGKFYVLELKLNAPFEILCQEGHLKFEWPLSTSKLEVDGGSYLVKAPPKAGLEHGAGSFLSGFIE